MSKESRSLRVLLPISGSSLLIGKISLTTDVSIGFEKLIDVESKFCYVCGLHYCARPAGLISCSLTLRGVSIECGSL